MHIFITAICVVSQNIHFFIFWKYIFTLFEWRKKKHITFITNAYTYIFDFNSRNCILNIKSLLLLQQSQTQSFFATYHSAALKPISFNLNRNVFLKFVQYPGGYKMDADIFNKSKYTEHNIIVLVHIYPRSRRRSRSTSDTENKFVTHYGTHTHLTWLLPNAFYLH